MLSITPQDEKEIQKWQQSLSAKTQLRLILTGKDPDEAFIQFCETLSKLVPGISIKKEKDNEHITPAIRIRDRVTYQALPLGPELKPFLSAMKPENPLFPPLSQNIKELIDAAQTPAFLKLYITPQCPFCPGVANQLITLSAASENIRISIIDGTMFPELAKENDVQSAPTVILDQFRWTSKIQIEEIARAIAHRDPAELSATALQGIIHEGAASKVAQMMLEKGKIFPSFMELLVHEKWPVRLGAMVVMEEIIEKDRQLAAQAINPLQEGFDNHIDQIKGDILYILGEIGNPEVIPFIRAVLKHNQNKEIRTAADEAIETIRKSL